MATKPSWNMAVGLIIGVVIGIMLDNIVACIGIGLAIAIAMNLK